ncbi:mycofactocin biosynthesis chaperone MftB [Nocardia asiatica]|uniref:mycofactocin biosynthesis chaperone MftB n=1 Tax=Nocardia asiatica TaxID=209252 RepID=UPI002459093A|nr:mycofactocin biosynthesis chaperone MftB [Nocardia asiatica]
MSTEPPPFDPARPYRLTPSVTVRPEPFGALLYDYGTRRLSFLKTPALVRVVRTLADHPDAASALAAAEVSRTDRPRYLNALADLAAAGTIQARSQA